METLDNELVEQSYEPNAVVIKPVYFALLSIATLGVYHIWWDYKVWRYIKEKDNSDIMPAARAIFVIIFGYYLFERIAELVGEKGRAVNYSPGAVFAAIFILNICSRLPEPFYLLAILSVIPRLFVVRELNFYFTGDLNGNADQSLSLRQVILLVVGLIFWGLIIVGLTAK
ncbi:MAG: hypothetical protein U0V74_04190 [Chitinophagales bacterium]